MLCGRQALVSCPDPELAFADKLSFEDILDYEAAKDEIIAKIYAAQRFAEGVLDKPFTSYICEFAHNVKKHYKDLMSEEKFVQRIYQCLE
jgi:hypothetical protein